MNANIELTANLPDILEQMAQQIRTDMRSFTLSETPEGPAITCHACGMTCAMCAPTLWLLRCPRIGKRTRNGEHLRKLLD